MSLVTRSLILADVAPPEGQTSNFNYCVKISNLKKYPNYHFFARTQSQNSRENASPYVLVSTDRCLVMSGYRPVIDISAIAKHKVASKDLKKSNSETLLANPKLVKSLIKTKETIYRPHGLPNSNEGKNVVGVYEIKSIDKTGLSLTPVDRSLTVANLIIFPILGATILGWIVWKRSHKTPA
jgi:hypothetical protein